MTESGRVDHSWIDSFVDYMHRHPTPQIFKKWSGISAVASAMERRCYTRTAHSALYPNLFTVLIAGPGIGKSVAIDEMHSMLARTGKVQLAPDSLTRAALLDQLLDTKQVSGRGIEHPLTIASSELGNLITAHDLEFLNTLNKLYDCPPLFRARTRGGGMVTIDMPVLNLLGGTQPKYFGEIMPEQAFGMGFTSRLLLVYADTPVTVPLFTGERIDRSSGTTIVQGLRAIAGLEGEFQWRPDAVAAIEEWHGKGCEPVPTSSRLQNYNARRIAHTIKLTMVHAAAHQTLEVQLADFQRAKDDLLEIEALMPEVFKDMRNSGSDTMLQEAFEFLMAAYHKNKKAVPHSRLVHFLSRKAPINQVNFYIQAMVEGGMIKPEIPGNNPALIFYIPQTLRDLAD